jgi:hypothetical protein
MQVVDNCCIVSDADPGGQYLLGAVPNGERTGIYEVSISDRKCIPLLPGLATRERVEPMRPQQTEKTRTLFE